MKKLLVIIIAVITISHICLSDYRDRSGQLSESGSTDTGLLITGCVVAGAGIITGLLLSVPEPELIIKKENMSNGLSGLSQFSGPLVLRQSFADSVGMTYGKFLSDEPASLVIKSRTNLSNVAKSNVTEIMDLKSAAKRDRISKIKTSVILGGGGLGVILVGASDNSSSTSGLIYAAGGILAAAGLITLALPSDNEKEYEEWEKASAAIDSSTSSVLNRIHLNVTTMKVGRIAGSSGYYLETIPCLQAKFDLKF